MNVRYAMFEMFKNTFTLYIQFNCIKHKRFQFIFIPHKIAVVSSVISYYLPSREIKTRPIFNFLWIYSYACAGLSTLNDIELYVKAKIQIERVQRFYKWASVHIAQHLRIFYFHHRKASLAERMALDFSAIEQ